MIICLVLLSTWCSSIIYIWNISSKKWKCENVVPSCLVFFCSDHKLFFKVADKLVLHHQQNPNTQKLLKRIDWVMWVTIITVFAGCWFLNISFISIWQWQWWSVHLWSPAMSQQICSLKGALLERPQCAGLRIREVIWHKNLCQSKHESICFSSFKDFVSVDSRITLKYRGLTKPNYMIWTVLDQK